MTYIQHTCTHAFACMYNMGIYRQNNIYTKYTLIYKYIYFLFNSSKIFFKCYDQMMYEWFYLFNIIFIVLNLNYIEQKSA